VQNGMSALPPKADICSALAHVRFVPEADMALRPDRWARALVSRLNKNDPGTAIMQRPLICRGSFLGGNKKPAGAAHYAAPSRHH
jgi:hypothetical protein